MSLPDQSPKLSKLPFLAGDAVLLGVAALIAHFAHDPFAAGPLIAIVACVVTAALLGIAPFVMDDVRAQEEALDARQRSLEALARTVAGSADQISIAASGFNEIAELAQKNLRHADQLPHRLQEKIAEFQAQLAAVEDAEKEELEAELATLRAADSERLESIADKVAKSTAEWAKLEAAAQKHLAAAADAIAKAHAQAGAALDEKVAAVHLAIATATAGALAALEVKLAALEAAAKAVPVAPPPPPAAVAVSTSPIQPPPEVPGPAASDETTAHPPKRPRKPRRDEPSVAEPAGESAAEISPPPESPAVEAAPAPVGEVAPTAEPPPVTPEKIHEIAPVAPHTAEPFPAPVPPAVPPAAEPPEAATPDDESAALEAAKTPRKRVPKKPEPDPEPTLSLGLDEPTSPSGHPIERVLTSDGATRLIATAYIGIGNRLFIRGEGPGLSWDKGVPLQFVSIGKWRWETNDATAVVTFKLYKNDELECSALGTQSLDPGHQHEVTAVF